MKNIIIFILFILIIIYFCLTEVANVDIGFHIRGGEVSFKNKSVIKEDLFSFSFYKKEWLNHQWLAQLIFYIFYDFLSEHSLVLLKLIILLITFIILFKLIHQRINNIYIAYILTIISAVAARSWFEIRPQIFTYLFLIIFFYLLENKKYLFLLPLIMLTWSNLHNGFIIGIFVLFMYFFKKPLPKFFIPITLLTIISTFINPYTYKLWLYPLSLQFSKSSFAETIIEWQRVNFLNSSFRLYTFLLILTWILFIINSKKMLTYEIFICIIFTYLSISAQRHVPLFILSCMPIIAKLLPLKINSIERLTQAKSFLILSIIFIFLLLFKILPLINLQTQIKENFLPKDATKFLKINKLKGNMFNLYQHGGYLIWKLYPQYKVFIDGRANTLYNERFNIEYQIVIQAKEGYRNILDKYKINFVLIEKKYPLYDALVKDNNWIEIYTDYINSIFLKKDKLDITNLKPVKGSYYYYQLANEAFNKKDYERAIKFYQKAIELNKDVPFPHNNLATCYTRVGKLKEAVKEYRIAIRINSKNKLYKENLKKVIKRIGYINYLLIR